MSVSKKENNIIGKRIEEIRKSKNMTHTQVADYLKMKRANYTSTEIRNDSRYFKDYQILDLAKLFDVSADYLLGLVDEPSADIEIKEISKKYGLSANALIEIKHSSEYLKENLNFFFENIGLLHLTMLIKDYTDISKVICKKDFLLQISYLSEYIIDKLKVNEKNKLKKFFDYCESNNECIMNILLSYDIDYGNIYQYFEELYNLIFKEDIKFTKKRENSIRGLLEKISSEYYSFSVKITNRLKITRLDLIEKMQYFLDEIRFSNQIEIGSKEFIKLFGDDEDELEKYLGEGYKQNIDYFNNKKKYVPFL